MTLTTLGRLHGTDKVANRYLPNYERHLAGVEVTSLLEIGVHGGASLRMWRDHFRHAHIYGLDIDPRCRFHGGGRIHVTIGSQDDPSVLTRLAKQAGGFDVVVDDGSHVNTHILKTFEVLWPHTRSLYVIEDLGNSYVDLTPHVAGWPGMHHNQDVDYRNDRSVMDAFFAERIAEVDDREMSSIHFYPGMAVLVK